MTDGWAPPAEETWRSPEPVPVPGWIVVQRDSECVWEPVALPLGPVLISDGHAASVSLTMVDERLRVTGRVGAAGCGGSPSLLWAHRYARVGRIVVVFSDDLRHAGVAPTIEGDIVVAREVWAARELLCERYRAAILIGRSGTGKTAAAHLLASHAGGRCEWIRAADIANEDADQQHRVLMAAYHRSQEGTLVVEDVDLLAWRALRVLPSIAKAITDQDSKQWRSLITTTTMVTPNMEHDWFGLECVVPAVHQRRRDIPALASAFARSVHPLLRLDACAIDACMSRPWERELNGLRDAVRYAAGRALRERRAVIGFSDFRVIAGPAGVDSYGETNDNA